MKESSAALLLQQKKVISVPHLLKYSTNPSIQLRRQSIQQAKAAPRSSLSLAIFTICLNASMIATIKDPKQIDPKEVVTERQKLPTTDFPQNPLSEGTNHQDPTTPATVVWIVFDNT